MKKIGLIGGLGPESTLEYYRGIIEAFRPTYEQHGFPEIVIESVNLRSFTEQAESGEWDAIAAALTDRLEVLRKAGAHFGAICSNTPHRVFEQVQQATRLPLVSIVEAARDHILRLGISRLCLLGTRFTMQSDFFKRALEPAAIRVVVPAVSEIEYIQEKIFSEIEFGIIKPATKARFLSIIQRLEHEQQIQGVILGCTELPMLLKPEDMHLHYVDTTAIHIAAIVTRCRRDELAPPSG